MLFVGSAFYYDIMQMRVCNLTDTTIVEYYYTKERAHIFTVIPYSIYFTPVLQVSENAK